ncbi:hypothetical protein Pla22_30640 [Rubripirellula amarantea]|uniref:GH16 domain-containing protein n=1 Tax=Rubripirellula amarantea TaxID=2527999 RepID=A0A5C5WKD3_9BACT|nr:hypothetical protein [Rubripirellula amarantea]TWT50322.1 hypothetical protein Pla22_30640 [Rubripirellula amarantea]
MANQFEWRSHSGARAEYFFDDKENVFVDDDVNLHLKITQRDDGRWSASEVSLTQSLGYGTYQWEVASRYDGLPSNVVVGLFTYISPQSVAEQAELQQDHASLHVVAR